MRFSKSLQIFCKPFVSVASIGLKMLSSFVRQGLCDQLTYKPPCLSSMVAKPQTVAKRIKKFCHFFLYLAVIFFVCSKVSKQPAVKAFFNISVFNLNKTLCEFHVDGMMLNLFLTISDLP